MIYFKSKNVDENIEVSNEIKEIVNDWLQENEFIKKLENNKLANIPKSYSYIPIFDFKTIYSDSSIEIKSIDFFGINKYVFKCIDKSKIQIDDIFLIDKNGSVWLRRQLALIEFNGICFDLKFLNKNLTQSDLLDRHKFYEDDLFLFKLPEGLDQYPQNEFLDSNFSCKWDLISNINKFKNSIKEMSSKW